MAKGISKLTTAPTLGLPNGREIRGALHGAGLRIGIAVSRYNDVLTSQQVRDAIEVLRNAGVADTDGLLEAGRTPAGRHRLAKATGLSEDQIRRWVHMSDLFRIQGVGSEFAELLEAAGVDSIKELRHRNPEHLAARMAEVNEQRHLTRQLPAATSVAVPPLWSRWMCVTMM